jgi:two-component system NtrC family sensor kinase
MKVLVAEDEAVSRITLTKVLERLGYEVISAIDGAKAWDVIESEDAPSLLLLDWEMPGLDGVDICRKLIDKKYKERRFYKILLTGRSGKGALAEGLESGADDFISKPFNIHELSARLNVGKRIIDMYETIGNQTKQLARADRMVSMGIMAAGIAHEVNNPVTFISGNIQLVEETWGAVVKELEKVPEQERNQRVKILKEEMPGILADMYSGTQRITEIVNSLKTFTRADENKKELLSIKYPIAEALKFSKNRIHNGIKINENYGVQLPEVEVNSVEVGQVFVNIFINSIDAIESHSGDGWIKIKTFEENRFIVTEISDSGPGIPDKLLEQLFTPFFTTKEVGKGTGLGLSISQKIIQDHGGSISVKNRAEGGAEFRILLPVASLSK